ncbi:hypothetical protein BC332_27369 [Capsicum chinense]|nr:hypothetical protein BC332_27369 [Capsicum chinense]
MATLIFEDMIGGHHLKAQYLVIPRAQEYARKTRFEHKQGRVWKIAWSIEDLRTHGDQSSNVVGENSNVGENISTVHDINVEGLHEEPTQTDNIDVEFGVDELSDLEGAEIDLNSSADSQEINIPEDDDSKGFEDIGRNKAARYSGRLGREEEYIDSSDLDSDDSRDQLKPEAVKGVDLPAKRKSKKVKFDPDCVMDIFELGMLFENVNVTTQTRA